MSSTVLVQMQGLGSVFQCFGPVSDVVGWVFDAAVDAAADQVQGAGPDVVVGEAFRGCRESFG